MIEYTPLTGTALSEIQSMYAQFYNMIILATANAKVFNSKLFKVESGVWIWVLFRFHSESRGRTVPVLGIAFITSGISLLGNLINLTICTH